MSDSLSGRVAVVTGAARGIGDAIAERLLADGARVFSLDKAAPTEPRDGVVYLEADVTDPASVAAAFTAIDAASGRLDILVNNAGIQRIGLVGKVSFADWSAVIATHLNGFFLCASEAVPRMAARGAGSIVSIASTAAFVGLPGRGAYCAAKAGILGLTRALSLEVATAGIRVNAIAPGFVLTDLTKKLWSQPKMQAWGEFNTPLKRLGQPEDMIGAAIFLASDASAWMTGQTLFVDGGFSAGLVWPIDFENQ